MDTSQHTEPNSKIKQSTVMFRGVRFEGPKLQGEIQLVTEVFSPLAPMRSSIQSNVYEDWGIARDHQNQPIPYLNIKYHVQAHDKAIIYLRTTGTETQRERYMGTYGNK
ncbi:hypothetical protein GJ744_010322 [Endocarpon pusillum]|uniref:Uncharacterized protein n=1 Tax=Endocarpon pusillum TaxID=364733 RepID=A0A8H7AI77_9EURO|nr:hypothetical protein GJ744_010322 [Endocarpon pusillum]